MTVQVKICGVNTEQALDAALESGADFFGLVFYPPSPRCVSHRRAAELVRHAGGRAASVALLVDPDDDEVRSVIDAVAPDYVQLHGAESPARVGQIRALAGRPVIKAVKVATESDAALADSFAGSADLILFDAKPPKSGDGWLPGGNGVAFDWDALHGIRQRDGFILSGGLDPDNVSEAIGRTGARVVDVSSGVERAPGDKDPARIRRFVRAAKAVPAREEGA